MEPSKGNRSTHEKRIQRIVKQLKGVRKETKTGNSREELIEELEELGAIDELAEIGASESIRFLAKRTEGPLKEKAMRQLELMTDDLIRRNDLKALTSIAKYGRPTYASKALDYLYAKKAINYIIEIVFINRPKISKKALLLLGDLQEWMKQTKNSAAIAFLAIFHPRLSNNAIQSLQEMGEFEMLTTIARGTRGKIRNTALNELKKRIPQLERAHQEKPLGVIAAFSGDVNALHALQRMKAKEELHYVAKNGDKKVRRMAFEALDSMAHGRST